MTLLLDVLRSLQFNQDKLAKVCEDALKKRWSADIKRPIKADQLTQLLNYFLDVSPNPLATIEYLVLEVFAEVLKSAQQEGADDDQDTLVLNSKLMPTLTKFTFETFYRVLLDRITSLISSLSESVKSEVHDVESVDEALVHMETTAKIFVAFTNFAKENTFATKRNLATLLKCSKKFFQELLRVWSALILAFDSRGAGGDPLLAVFPFSKSTSGTTQSASWV
eukprot:m.822486 g.822486  ORF g.822486 m.822486 type:complete len:223 (+) comp59401_c1_seq5:3172-3840(+)